MYNTKYQITDAILTWLSDIAEIRGKIAQAKILPVRETIFRRRAIIKMAHSSTSIEGKTLSEPEVEKIASKQSLLAPAKDRIEVENYLLAISEVESLSKKTTLDLTDLLQIHQITMQKLLPDSKAGMFRTTPVYIVNSAPGLPDKIVYTPPEPKQVKSLVTKLLQWHNNNPHIHPVIRAAILHFEFESIHPFVDGNGRTGRLLTLLSLYQSGWDFRRGLVLEEYYNLDRRSYYEALQNGREDLTSWISYFVKGFWVEALHLQESINSLLAGTGSLHERKLSVGDLKIIDFVVTLDKITSSDVADILDIPKRTAQSHISRLLKLKILEKIGSGPSTYYILAKVR